LLRTTTAIILTPESNLANLIWWKLFCFPTK